MNLPPSISDEDAFAQSFVATVQQPFLVLDHELRVKVANQSFYDTFKVSAEETIGDRIFDLGNKQWDILSLKRVLQEVLPSQSEVTRFEVRHVFPRIGNRVMLINARRLIRDANKAPLIFLSIDDVTDQVADADRTKQERDFSDAIIETLRDPLLVLDGDLHVIRANDAFYGTFAVDKDETRRIKIYELGNGQWDIPKLRELLENTLEKTCSFRDFEVDHVFPSIGHKVMRLNGRALFNEGEKTRILLVIEDITERRRRDAIVKFHARALNSVNDAVVALEGGSKITFWNLPAEKLFDLPSSVVMGRPIKEVCDRIEIEDATSADPLFADRGDFQTEGWIEHHLRLKESGRELWLESATAEVEGEDFKPGRMVVLRDVTTKKRVDLELRRKNEDLELFTALVSHDLQEPLRAVSSYVSLLANRYKGKLDADADEFIGFAVSGASRMKQLISDLLRYAQAQIDLTKLKPVNLQKVVNEALQDLKILVQESGAEIIVGELPEIVVDTGLMRLVFSNLISNGIKYRSDKPIRITIDSEMCAGRDSIICVRDNGKGFDMKQADRIFRLFQRLEPKGEATGTGIGLTLTKKIIEAHGGKIWAESKVGMGSHFYFSVPSPENSMPQS
jgi:PAS domain S-box-containing protein